MRKTPDTKKIGIFALGGIGLFVFLILIAIGDKIFMSKHNQVVFYFEESIKGLSVGSSVVFKGVSIGKVTSITLDVSPEKAKFLIPVTAQINDFYDEGDFSELDDKEIVEHFINQGLRAQLVSQNMLTGQLMIELEFSPEQPAVYRGGDDNEYLEIPTVLSQLEALTKDIKNIPISEIMHELDILLKNVNLKAPTILANLTRFTTDLNAPINATLTNDNLVGNMNHAVQNIGQAARALRIFADYIERNPQALIMGKGKY